MEAPPEDAAAPEPRSNFPIVGVGASAGGLEAFTQMLSALPADTGAAFVLVQHLAPTHASLLAEILSRSTAIPVAEVEDEPRVEPNRVYVIPPGRNMIISQGALQLLPREEIRSQHRPIDFFLRSLAADQRNRAIGVILSGTATDGTLGMEEIKAEGGITFAQDDTAQQNSMPRSAISTGCVDFVLPPDEIAREIGRIARHPYVAPPEPARRKTRTGEPDPARILETVRRATGVDFTFYKANTLRRRITRRMVLHRMESWKEYERFLRSNPGEVAALYQDILINVTSFFRDPETFESLKTGALPKLWEGRSGNEPLRAWVLGCSTGEEAYSLAITFAEFAEARGSQLPVQIFASDLNEAGIAKARAGVYSKNLTPDVSPERLRRFFVEVDGSYRVRQAIRDMCVFAQHNVLTDPPFSQIDLISCRNMLIYLESGLQARVMPLLHYALKPAGFLLLGSSETVGSYRDLFEVEDARHKIYAKKPGSHRVALGPMFYPGRGALGPGPGRGHQAAPQTGGDVQREAERILLTRYVPPGVLVNGDLEILQFRGETGPYLAPAPGKASLNLLRMAREGLLIPLQAAIRKARKGGAAVREERLRIQSEGGSWEVDLEVVPVKGGSAGEGGFLILFEEPAPASLPRGRRGKGEALEPEAGAEAGEEARDQEVARLKQELAAAREYLQTVTEQQEAANEELQSANEEAQSANEELKSINEELETSKEEIQSSNEELATVNDELQHRNLELHQVNNDLVNLLGSVEMPIVMLGQDLRVRRFTPAAAKIFKLTPSDVGRPIGDVQLNLGIPELEPLLVEVIDTVSVRESEVQDRQGHWYSLRIRPYKTLENRIDGAVILLVDVDTLRRAREFAESIVATLRESLLVLDADLRVTSASRSFYETFQVIREATEGRFLYELGEGRPWDIPELRRLLAEMPPHGDGLDGYELEQDLGPMGRKTLLLNARRLLQAGGQSSLILLAIEDVTARKRLETDLRQRVEELAAADRSKNEFLALLAHELRNPLAPLRNAAHVLEVADGDGAAVEKARDVMNRQIHHMVRLIDDLLDVSRITQGKIQLRRQPVDLAALLTRAAEQMRPGIEARGQELLLSLPRELIEVDADPTRLEQVFGNLLSNACKFAPKEGHIWVTAGMASNGPDSPEEVVVRVRDDGIGMAPETLPRVFELFMQADRSLDRSRGGLGIGLTMVQRLVALHGGCVSAHSAGPGKGSEFVVRLPVLPPGDTELRRRGETGGSTGAGSPVPPLSRRVLVVDDNVDTAESLAYLLRFKGHQVEVAFDGLGALETATSFRPEVVLLDIGLPGLDGYEVASRLRRGRRRGRTLLVALTGYGQEEDQRRAREAGFDYHLTKPVDPHAIYELLARPLSLLPE